MIHSLRSLGISASIAVAVGLSGCMGAPADAGLAAPLTPTQRYSLQVEPGIDRIALAVHETGLSDNQRGAIFDLARRAAQQGAERVVVEAPAGGDPAASDAAWRVKAELEAAGVPGALIQVFSYPAPDPRAPVLAGFETIRAHVPQCGTTWGSLSRSGSNQASSNFGCAVTANMAAQIANPRDIVEPAAMAEAYAGRRSVVFDAYRAGQQTSAPQEELVANRRIAQAVE